MGTVGVYNLPTCATATPLHRVPFERFLKEHETLSADWMYKIGIDRLTRGSDDGHQKGSNLRLRGFSLDACYEDSVLSSSLHRLLRLKC
jgi:hypothetical protein